MTLPKSDIPEGILSLADDICDQIVGHGAPAQEAIARAIMAAKAEGRERAALIAEAFMDPIDIAHVIRHGEA